MSPSSCQIAQVWHHLTSALFHNSVGAISGQGIPLTNLSFHFDLYETCSNIFRYHTTQLWILCQRGNPRKNHVPRRNHSETHFVILQKQRALVTWACAKACKLSFKDCASYHAISMATISSVSSDPAWKRSWNYANLHLKVKATVSDRRAYSTKRRQVLEFHHILYYYPHQKRLNTLGFMPSCHSWAEC